MIYGAYHVKRATCCRCGATDRPLFTMQVLPGKQPWLEPATPGDVDASACSDCWLEVGDVVFVRFGVAVG